MPDKSLLKIIIICSMITGGILGIIPIIPAFIWIAFLLIMFAVAPFIIIYLKRLNLIKEIELQNCLTIGALSGFFSYIGFTIIYFPLAFILNLIFKIASFVWIKVMLTNIGFLIPMVIFIALLCALMNTFSAFLTVYIYECLKKEN